MRASSLPSPPAYSSTTSTATGPKTGKRACSGESDAIDGEALGGREPQPAPAGLLPPVPNLRDLHLLRDGNTAGPGTLQMTLGERRQPDLSRRNRASPLGRGGAIYLSAAAGAAAAAGRRSAPPSARTMKPMPARISATPTTMPKSASCSAM
jgi:hypothetical protein